MGNKIPLVSAQRFIGKLNNENKIENGPYFVKVLSEDGNIYQIKFNWTDPKTGIRIFENTNEFITYYLAKELDFPILNGAFIKFKPELLQKLYNILISHNLYPIQLNNIKNNILFGIEWKSHSTPLKYQFEINEMLKDISNKKDFFSIYPFDQYLKNYDRHEGNHLIIKDDNRKAKYYTMIDGDKIFMNKDYQTISEIRKEFECLMIDNKNCNWHQFLYSIVDDDAYNEILDHTSKIDRLEKETFKKLNFLLDHYYYLSKLDLAIIYKYLRSRKAEIFLACLRNSSCFPNLSQTRLS